MHIAANTGVMRAIIWTAIVIIVVTVIIVIVIVVAARAFLIVHCLHNVINRLNLQKSQLWASLK